jgi:hypothetical protein
MHINYAEFEKNRPDMKKHVDAIYDLVDVYAKANRIKLAYGDDAERFVEAIATYITVSERRLQENE